MLLHRPLAYKGPIDHLSQFFSIKLLYQASQLLLDEHLLDWQFSVEKKLLTGVFLNEQQLVKAQLGWPLKHNEQLTQCSCNAYDALPANSAHSTNNYKLTDCQHIAALAIEAKVKLEKLPAPVKAGETLFNSELYVDLWLKRQVFDPFPNMARHRVVYILQWQNQVLNLTVFKAYLTQQNHYQKKADLLWESIDKVKLPKFVSLTDQQILEQIHQTLNDSKVVPSPHIELSFQFPRDIPLLELIVKSRRCFWGNCYRAPLTWGIQDTGLVASQLACMSQQSDPQQSDTQQADTHLLLHRQILLDRHRGQLVHVTELSTQAARHFRLVSELSQADVVITPCLNLSSKQITVPWKNSALNNQSTLDIDFAKVSFLLAQQSLTMVQLLDQNFVQTYPILFSRIVEQLYLIDGLPGIGAYFEQPISQKFLLGERFLTGNLSHWLILFRGLQLAGWQIQYEANFKLNQITVDNWYSQVSINADNNVSQTDTTNDWFDWEIGVTLEGEKINLLPYLVELLQSHGPSLENLHEDVVITLKQGSRIQLKALRIKNILANLVELSEKSAISKQQKLRLPINQFSRVSGLEKQIGRPTLWKNAAWLKQKSERLNNQLLILPISAPSNVAATLRHYQEYGVGWLQFLRQETLSGILADDMGLGKTVQTLTHLQIEKNQLRLTRPCLIVAPTSLLGNWMAEIKRFTPQLKTIQWSGAQRTNLQDQLIGQDLIITSYGLLQRDAAIFNQLDLYYLILDEAQTIKNSSSKIAKIAFNMKSQHRLCLTGTPLENHLGELWSLFHFLMPDFLGSSAKFKRLFQIPIEKNNDKERQDILAQRISFFMLRREKNKVAADLPAKTIINEIIELSEHQADLYEAVRLSTINQVQLLLANSNAKKNPLLIGNALLKLRQICCHPILISSNRQKYNLHDSAKLNWLSTVLPEMLENQRKILIFSSFTQALDLIAELLTSLKINYQMLTGKSRNRTDLVEQFQQGNVPVFLISLKAGGAGLNLTQADTVIHFDPWWNPAAENQASDRAHRIGQDKPVFVYKLICKGTVEEKIASMQQKKSSLADNLYSKNELLKPLSQLDWRSLLVPLSE